MSKRSKEDACLYGTPCGGSPNILVDGDIELSVSGPTGGDAEIQIEAGNHLEAGRDIILKGLGEKSQIQTKKDVTLVAVRDIILSAPGSKSEVQAEDDNTYTAGRDILLETGTDGKLEVKKGSDFDAGTAEPGDIDIIPGAGTDCKIEAPPSPLTPTWSASGGSITFAGCDAPPLI